MHSAPTHLSRHRRGLAMREVIVLIIVVLVGLALWSLLRGVLLARVGSNVTTDGSKVLNIVRSLEQSGANQFDGMYLSPSRVAAATRTVDDDATLNTTANLYSALVSQNYVGCDLLVGACDPSQHVAVKDDYDFTSYQPTADSPTFWDPSFQADLTTCSHASFAHEPLVGKRHEMNWRVGGSSDHALVGSRGVEGGVTREENAAVYDSSITPGTYWPQKHWIGVVACGDGHVETIERFFIDDATLNIKGAAINDNLYRVDSEHKPISIAESLDSFLTFTKSISSVADGNTSVATQFD